jgi:phage terminase small subunit
MTQMTSNKRLSTHLKSLKTIPNADITLINKYCKENNVSEIMHSRILKMYNKNLKK